MKKLGFAIIIVVLLLIINGLLHSIVDLWQKQDLLTTAQKQLNTERLKNAKLKGDLSYVQSQQFIDETARNKLFLSKPGEEQVIMSPDINNNGREVLPKMMTPNWKQWLTLFF